MGDARPVVFFCTVGLDERREITKHCLGWWRVQPVELHVLTPATCKCSVLEFNRERRVYADNHAEGIHIVADDDCFVECDILQAVELAECYPQFGTLSLWPSNCSIFPWTEIESYQDENVMEHCSVGGVRVSRKGLPFPPSEGIGYDRTHADAIRRIGKKVGYLKNFSMIHLGEGKSQIWK